MLPAKAQRRGDAPVHRIEELEPEPDRYRRLFQVAPVGSVITDGAGVVFDANPAAAELLGRSVEELVGAPMAGFVGAERQAKLTELIEATAHGSEWEDRVPFVGPGGGRVRLLVHAAGDTRGPAATIAWTLSVPTEAVSTPPPGAIAAANRLQRDRLSAMLHRLHHGVVSVDSSLRVSYANAAAERMLAQGRDLSGETLPEPWPAPSLRALAAGMFEHRAEPEEDRVTLDDGAVYEVLALPADASGEALLVLADVTVNERRQRAEREFVANAAHQLRTPVSAIASAIEVLQGGAKDDPDARDRFLAHLDRQCTRLVGLTRALLLLARAQALDEPPRLEIVPLRPLLDQLAGGLRPLDGVRVRVECPSDLAALGNRDLLDQAIGNLAENAARHTVDGEIVLCAEPYPGGKVRIVVSDTGPGGEFPSDGSFQRFYKDPSAPGEGFGLGLAIAAEAMRVLGGELRMESTAKGTRAGAILPAATMNRR